MAQLICLGNEAERISDKRHAWKLYVRGTVNVIQKVVIKLHPSFKQPVRESTGPLFEFKSSGWGTFDIDVEIYWKNGTTLRTTWELQFERRDSHRFVEIPPDVLAGISTEERKAASFAPDCASAADHAAATSDHASSDEETDEADRHTARSAAELPTQSSSDLHLPDVFSKSQMAVGEPSGIGRPKSAEPIAAAAAAAAEAPAAIAATRDVDIEIPAADAIPKAKAKAKATSKTRAKARARSVTGSRPDARDDVLPSIGTGEIPIDPALRPELCTRLQAAGFLPHGHALFMHGRGYDGPTRDPKCAWASRKPPRDDHEAPPWLTASEFEDHPDVLMAKCRQLAQFFRLSQKTVAYTGAGISAAVIGQAARSGQNTVGWKADTRKASPTFTHHALGFLGRNGLIHSWVQQNHDGLPQKAGFPQEFINEIHGSWYDPCNPVVKYSGSLHDRAFPWMEDDANTADLVIVLGTSLGGLNADQVAINTAERSLIAGPGGGSGGALGTVCINLQQTEQDGKMTLRLFGKSDDILRGLLAELGFGRIRLDPVTWPLVSRAQVPYDAEGRRLPAGARRLMWLDLGDGQQVRITAGHNIQGARQPQYMHIGASRPYVYKGVRREPGVGLGRIVRRDEAFRCVLVFGGSTLQCVVALMLCQLSM